MRLRHPATFYYIQSESFRVSGRRRRLRCSPSQWSVLRCYRHHTPGCPPAPLPWCSHLPPAPQDGPEPPPERPATNLPRENRRAELPAQLPPPSIRPRRRELPARTDLRQRLRPAEKILEHNPSATRRNNAAAAGRRVSCTVALTRTTQEKKKLKLALLKI